MSDIDRQMQQPGFWDNPQQNAALMQQRRGLERRLETLNRLRSDADELAAWRELLEEGDGDPDFDRFIDRVAEDVEKLERLYGATLEWFHALGDHIAKLLVTRGYIDEGRARMLMTELSRHAPAMTITWGVQPDNRAAIIGALAGYLSLWSVYHLFRLATGKEGMGFGDFKLLAALGDRPHLPN